MLLRISGENSGGNGLSRPSDKVGRSQNLKWGGGGGGRAKGPFTGSTTALKLKELLIIVQPTEYSSRSLRDFRDSLALKDDTSQRKSDCNNLQ